MGGTVSAAHLIIVVVYIFLVVTLPASMAAAPTIPRQQKKPRREVVHDHPNCVRHATLSTACTNELIAQHQHEEAEASKMKSNSLHTGGFEDLVGAALHKRCLQLVTDLTKCNMLNKKATVEKYKQQPNANEGGRDDATENTELGTIRHPCQPDVDVLEACHAEAKKQTTTTPNQMEVLEALDTHCGEFAQELQRCMMLHTTKTEEDESEHDLIEIVLEAEL